EIIAKANETSGPLAALPELDDARVDLAKVIARARALAQAAGAGDLDDQLSALRDGSAAPVDISVEAASAELARQLGGTNVAKRERWAPPPPVAEPATGYRLRATGGDEIDEIDTPVALPPEPEPDPAQASGDEAPQ